MSRNKSTHTVITFATILAVQGALAANITPATKAAVADYTRPISFEPNRGQTDKQVDFLARGAGYGLFLSRGKAVMAFKNVAVRMSPVGANASPNAEALDPQSSQSNYFIGNVPENWHTNIANYAKVRYRNVYSGIDLIYYGNQRQLEYDFVVAPGGDPNTIALQFDGAAKPVLELSGDLVMHTAAGELRWHKPIAYQEVNGNRQLVACDYVRKSRRLGFKLAAYDRAKPLIIDPVLEYSTYLGGSGAVQDESHEGGGDAGNGIAVDAHGSAYVVGTTVSADFPTKNAFQKKLGSVCCSNAFVTKFDTTGKLVYSTYLGGSGFVGPDATFEGDLGLGIAVDAHGNAYVTGLSGSENFPLKNAFQNQNFNSGGGCLPCWTGFVTKLDAAGNALIFSTYLGGHGLFNGDGGNSVAVDASDNVYVTGFTDSPDFPTKDAFQGTLEGGIGIPNAFVTKFDAGGKALVYSTYLGGNNGRNAIAVDRKGNAYIAGSTSSPDLPTKNAFQTAPADGFVTKFNAAGTALAYSTYFPAGLAAIAVDRHQNVYITGTAGPGLPTKNAFQKTSKSLRYGNAFVTKIAASGNALVYSTYLGGSAENPPGDGGTGIAVDAHGNAFITGFTTSTDFPTKNAIQTAFRGGFDPNAFVAEIDAAGCALVYSTYLGGSGPIGDSGSGIAVDKHGNAYVVGTTSSTDFPTKDAFQPMLGRIGVQNAFVTKISAH